MCRFRLVCSFLSDLAHEMSFCPRSILRDFVCVHVCFMQSLRLSFCLCCVLLQSEVYVPIFEVAA